MLPVQSVLKTSFTILKNPFELLQKITLNQFE